MKNYILITILTLSSFEFHLPQSNSDKTFIIIPRKSQENSNISFGENVNGVIVSAFISFPEPNLHVIVTHIPETVDYFPELLNEEIEVTYAEIFNSKNLFAENLSFRDWDKLEKSGKKVFMIFKEDIMSKEKFVFDHKFKALGIRIAANGPI